MTGARSLKGFSTISSLDPDSSSHAACQGSMPPEMAPRGPAFSVTTAVVTPSNGFLPPLAQASSISEPKVPFGNTTVSPTSLLTSMLPSS